MAKFTKVSRSDSIDELFQCPICLDILKSPKVLPCGHVFCLQCLRKEEDNQTNKFLKSCPTCRAAPTPRLKAEFLPGAYMAEQMMERIPLMKVNGVTDDIIDKLVDLMSTRQEKKKQEEREVEKLLEEQKEEIKQNIEQVALNLLQGVRDTLEARKATLLKQVERTYEEKFKRLRRNTEKADDPSMIKSWLWGSINQEPPTSESLLRVLPSDVYELGKQFSPEHSSDGILESLDPDGVISSVPRHKKCNRIVRQECLNAVEAQLAEYGPKELSSRLSETPLVNNPPNSTDTSLELPVSVSARTTCPFITQEKDYPNIVEVTVQHWKKDLRNRGYVLATGSSIRSRTTSAPTKVPVTSIRQRMSSLSTSAKSREQSYSLQLTLKQEKGYASLKAMRLHVNQDFISIATEDEDKTDMRVFTTSDTRRRRQLLSSKMSSRRANAVVAIMTLSNFNGWCMLFQKLLLMFDHNGRMNLEHPLVETSIICAEAHRQDQFIAVNNVCEVVLISVAGNEFGMKPLQSEAVLFPGGRYFDVATLNDALFIAHTEDESRNGNIICCTGLESEELLQKNRAINPPSGFAEVSHPTSICCNGKGSLFALWRDQDNRKGTIIEYRIDDPLSLPDIAMENADKIYTITCSHQGDLITASLNM